MGNISAYFEKWSTNVYRYIFFLGVRGYGPVMYIEGISEWSYWISKVAERGRVFAASLLPPTRVALFDVILY
jgi:hypothetical protein